MDNLKYNSTHLQYTLPRICFITWENISESRIRIPSTAPNPNPTFKF